MKVNDINMYYEITGEGEPLLLIMGLGADISRWHSIIPVLSKEYAVIAFDNRGAGMTDKPDIPYTMGMMADDTAGLLDALGIGSAHTFGVSLGGMIAINYALRHPDKIRSLILGCTRCGGTQSIPDTSEGRDALNPELVEVLSAEERARAMLPFLWSRDFIENNPETVEEHIAIAKEHPIDPAGYRHQMEAAGTHDTYERLPEIKLPTLVIAGTGDRLIPFENSQIIASRIPGAELALLEGKGHSFHSEAVEESTRIIMDFMKRYSAR